MNSLTLNDFPSKTFDKLRYGDTDRQGHVNNAKFSSFLETGRVEFLYNPDYPILVEGYSFVIASLRLNFLNEITWPGQVDIGTGIVRIGNSSIKVFQKLFQDGKCVADAETVVVQVDSSSGRSAPLSDKAKKNLSVWLLKGMEE